MENTKKSAFSFAAILIWIAALCAIITDFNFISMMLKSPRLPITSLLINIVPILALIYLGITYATDKLNKTRMIPAVLLLLCSAADLFFTVKQYIGAGASVWINALSTVLGMIIEVLLWLFMLLYFVKGKDDANLRIKNVFTISFINLAVVVIGLLFNIAYGQPLMMVLKNKALEILSIVAIIIFASPGYRLPMSEASVKVKKLRNVIIAIVIIVIVIAAISGLLDLIDGGGSGGGSYPSGFEACFRCHGSGMVNNGFIDFDTCPTCGGSGMLDSH